MVLIKMDTVYVLTILLCGLWRKRKREGERERETGRGGEMRKWMGLIENACRSLVPNMKRGVFGEKRKYSKGKGGRAKCLWE